jgi:hypothetical protein
MFVLITIPHRLCIAKVTRTCDLRAESCSKILITILKKQKIKHGTVKMTVPRLDVDFNRMKPKIVKKTKKIHKLPLNYKRTQLYTPYLNTPVLYIKKPTYTQETPTLTSPPLTQPALTPPTYTHETPTLTTPTLTPPTLTSPTLTPPTYTHETPTLTPPTLTPPTLTSPPLTPEPTLTQNQSSTEKPVPIQPTLTPSSTVDKIYKPIQTPQQKQLLRVFNDLKYYKNDYYHDDTIDNKNKLVSNYWEEFNDRIKKIIKDEKAKQHKIVLLDIHSFPKGSFGGAQIAIIDIYKTHRVKLDKFAIYIINKMHIDIRIFDGLDNHIQNTYKKSTYPLLLEFCEDRTYLLNETIKLFFEELIDFFKP